jgi:hypothetical protein
MRHCLSIVLALLLVGCTRPESAPVQDKAAVAPAPSASASVAMADKPMQANTATPRTPEPATAKPSPRLALDGDGLRVFDATTGSSRPIAFGTAADEAMRMLETVQGGPASDHGENSECRADYATWPDGLTAWFTRGNFVGWSVSSADSTLATASGIKVRSTRRDLESAYDAHIARSTLGVEFTAGGLAGLLASGAADARVTNLWAGTTCIAR